MNKQEIFNTVAQHLLSQNERSMENDRCAYRNSAGLKCAVGCLIPDEKYSEDLEGKTVRSFYDTNLFEDVFDPKNNEIWRMLSHLQDIHDGASTVEWYDYLKEYAEINTLEWNYE